MTFAQREYNNRGILLSLMYLSFCLFTLSGGDFYGFQARFVVFAKEMLVSDLAWFPSSYHQYYPDYTALSSLLIVWASSLTHSVTRFSAIFPTAVASSLIVWMLHRLLAPYDERFALASVLCLGLCHAFWQASRLISLDQFVSMVTLGSYLAVRSVLFMDNKKAWGWVAINLILGFGIRGPIGFVIPSAMIVVVLLVEKRFSVLCGFVVLSLLGLVFLLCMLLGLAYETGGTDFMRSVLHSQFIGRIHDRSVPYYFYALVALRDYALTVPIALLTMLLLFFKKIRPLKEEKAILWHASAWILIILIGMSVPHDKKMRYVLAIAPPAAILAGYFFSCLGDRTLIAFYIRQAVIIVCQCINGLCVCLFAALPFLLRAQPVLAVVPVGLGVIISFLLSALSLSYFLHRRVLLVLLSTVLMSFTVDLLLVEPVLNKHESSQAFVEAVLQQAVHPKTILFYQMGPNDLDNVLIANLPSDWEAQFVTELALLEKQKSASLIVMRQSAFDALPEAIRHQLQLVYAGKISHRRSVLLHY